MKYFPLPTDTYPTHHVDDEARTRYEVKVWTDLTRRLGYMPSQDEFEAEFAERWRRV